MLEGLRHLFSPNRPPLLVTRDLLDILIVAFVMYRGLLVLKGTRAMQMGLGFLAFGALYMLAKFGELATVMKMLSWLAQSAILIVVVVFQNDIRRALIRVGSKAWLGRGRDAQERVISEVVAAATELARHRMGALICLERDANVMEFVKSDGLVLDSNVTRELLVSLFIPESMNKTHDGAVLIRDLQIARAGVFFPMPDTTKISDPTLGSRHRAAIGITEETDAVVVVVSEERGTITLCFPNGIVQNVDGASLRQALMGLFGNHGKRKRWFLGRRRAKQQEDLPPPSSVEKKSGKTKKAAPAAPAPGNGASAGAREKMDSNSAEKSDKPRSKSKSPHVNKRSDRFAPLSQRQGESMTPPPSVSVPMPSGDDSPVVTIDEETESPAPATSTVSKPMAPTDLPFTALSEDP